MDTKRMHRVLIRVNHIFPNHISAIIVSWNPNIAVMIPKTAIAPELHDQLAYETYLLGEVNIGARDTDELRFENINEIISATDEAL